MLVPCSVTNPSANVSLLTDDKLITNVSYNSKLGFVLDVNERFVNIPNIECRGQFHNRSEKVFFKVSYQGKLVLCFNIGCMT